MISNDGVVASGSGYLGFGSASIDNVAFVTGAGSLWTTTGGLTIGSSGRANQLVVSNGGTVSVSNVTVGFNSPSTVNRATVDGGMLHATNAAARARWTFATAPASPPTA